MTRKLYWKDAYMKEFDAKVVKSVGTELVLDQTMFYPTGGGQQNGTGRLVAGEKEYRVVDMVGFDIQTDGGTHVLNTKEIGRIRLSRFDNKGSGRKRMGIVFG